MAVSIPKARGELREILTACRAVEERRRAPFEVDVAEARSKVAEFFPHLEEIEDLRLDAAVLNGLARVLQIQEARLRYEAGLFLADPQMLAGKVAQMSFEALASAFLESWHPVAQLEQVTIRGIEAAKRYFDSLTPWADRLVKPATGRPPELERWDEADLAAKGILRKEGFLGFLGDLWAELKGLGPMEYWSFVKRGDATSRAYGAAFLVSYGYADLEETAGHLTLRPNEDRVVREGSRSAVVVLGGAP